MNQIANTTQAQPMIVSGRALSAEETGLLKTLGDSIYPGAVPESILMVVDYCRNAGLNPMLKPVHIVPMSVKQKSRTGGKDEYVWRDVIMPGVAHYRTQASRSGEYLGKTEPEFGPDVNAKLGGVDVTYPAWCKVTVRRAVGHHVAEFTAKEIWTENYATSGRESAAPNAMWKKRPYGQLAKVAEAQALRMAFPELLGGSNTAEEMEGKELGFDAARDVTPKPAAQAKPVSGKAQLDSFAGRATINGGAAVRGDVIDGEAVRPEVPVMPEDARLDLEQGKAGKAWKWFTGAVDVVPPHLRHGFVTFHSDLLDVIAASSEERANIVAQIRADASGEVR